MPDLKLIALDASDLAVLSAHLQDAVLRVEDVAYLKVEKRFALVANRFDWATAHRPGNAGAEFVRRRTGLRFERVLGAQVQGLDLSATDRCLELLAVTFTPAAADSPDGHITLTFAGGAGIRLEVECIEAELKDLGAAWRTEHKPSHADDDQPDTASGAMDASKST
jgi:hypothetical protein